MNLIETIWQRVPVGVWLTASAIAVVAGDYAAKRWSLDRGGLLFWSAVVCYGLASQFYLPTLLRHGLITTSIVWVILSTAGFLILGTIVFHEHLRHHQWLGVIFGVVSILLLSI